ncbi:MAG TPA: hypothetical protein VGI19_16045 [Candidatus Cybelea sp.]
MNIEDRISPAFRRNAKIIGGDEIAWRGTDIVAVLNEIVRAGAVILGLESVVFQNGSSAPMVDAISDCSMWLPREPDEPWEHYADRTLARSISDIERNVPNPYGNDVWYIVASEQHS